MNLTAVISKGEEFFIGQIKEIPGVFSQGKTIDETKTNLMDALNLWLEDSKEDLSNEIINVVHTESLEINVH
ncbi:MAG: type II toxin-antitoxin system HicB family antitoxin [Anditalea sp.]